MTIFDALALIEQRTAERDQFAKTSAQLLAMARKHAGYTTSPEQALMRRARAELVDAGMALGGEEL